MSDPARVVLGRVLGAHGLRGAVRVRYLGDGPDNLMGLDALWLGETADDRGARRFEVEGAGSTGRAGEVRLALAGVADRESATALRGALVLADPEAIEPLPDGEFYWHQLIGCEVVRAGGGAVGRVEEIWETGAHDVLVVRSEDGGQHLFSTARELMPEVDLVARRIVVSDLPGLLGKAFDSDSDADSGPDPDPGEELP